MTDSIKKFRQEFPVTQKWIYFNHAGVAPIPQRTAETIHLYTEEVLKYGACYYERWMERVEGVRSLFAEMIGAEAGEIAFVKNTSHGLSLVAGGIHWNPGDNVVTVHGEFPSNIYPWMNLKERGVELKLVTPKEGRVRLEDIVETVDEKTRLLTISSVEFGTGFRNDLESIGSLCKEKEILFCVDAIQSLGAIPLNVKECHIDFLAADGHKWLLAPEGLGGFYCAREKMESLQMSMLGWNSVVNARDFSTYDFTLRNDAQRFEEGTLSIVGVMALGTSLELLKEAGIPEVEKRILSLTDAIADGLLKRGIKVRSPRGEGEKSGIVSFETRSPVEQAHHLLTKKNVACACRDGALRVSPHFYNSEEEVEIFLNALDQAG